VNGAPPSSREPLPLVPAVSLQVFQGRAGDRNELAVEGARAVGEALGSRLGLGYATVGKPAPALGLDWAAELGAALPDLRAMADRLDALLCDGRRPVAALSRCAVAMATLPIVARHRPDACVVWLDAHADLHTPETTASGYLGGMALAAPLGLWQSGLGAGLALRSVVLAGQRKIDPAEAECIERAGLALLAPAPDLPGRLRAAVAGRPVYVHVDCDVLRTGLVPTEYTNDEGLSLVELRAACESLADSEIVGVEVAEFQISWRKGGPPVCPALLVDALAPLLNSVTRPG
jgi:hypothetical protein